ncbi:MAG: ribbon-helix-helix domain-containing protein [Trichocoleus desertorum ATA4-8-CV12]|jgi:hypothetical protein|nr:ribbon-helix-helix domain-containing protein [Trichocoleus desertorum ATA4-8-CV12]
MNSAFNWKPEQGLLEQLVTLARRRGQSPEAIINEAVTLYLDIQSTKSRSNEPDPLIGLFAGSPDLATKSEEILQQGTTEQSGWTWKEPLQ